MRFASTAIQRPSALPAAHACCHRGTILVANSARPMLLQAAGQRWQQQLGRRRQLGRQRQHWRCCQPCASYTPQNPQNVDQCQTQPAPEYSAEQSVTVQLQALQCNDEPWGNHGVQTAYEWGLDIGGMDPSMYFGFPKDLYHFDHFMGMFGIRLAGLINHAGFEVCKVEEQAASGDAPATTIVTVSVTPGQGRGTGQQQYEFQLRRNTLGARKGALMTYMLRPAAQ